MKKTFMSLLLIMVVMALAYAGSVSAAGITIKGRVVNGTDSNKIYSGQDVQLLIFTKGGSMERKKVITDAEGAFHFFEVTVKPESVYMVTTTYSNVLYHSGRIALGEAKEVEAPLTVYETTPTGEAIYIDSEHIIIEREADAFRVTEMLSLTNRGNRTYVGQASGDKAEPYSLSFPLPEGYKGLKIMEMIPPQFIQQKPDGFSIVKHVVPGTYQFGFSYQLAGAPLPIRWDKKIVYPTKSLSVLHGDPTTNVTSKKGTDMGTVKIGDREYLLLKGEELSAGASFPITIRSGAGVANWVRQKEWLLMVVFIIGLGAVVGIFLVIKSARRKSERGEASSRGTTEEQRSELVKYIAALDDRFQAGQVSPEEYEKERGEKKAQLLEIARIMEQGERGPKD